MLPLLVAASEEVCQGAAGALKNVVHACLSGNESDGQHAEAIGKLEAGLGAVNQEAWPSVLLGSPVSPLFNEVTRTGFPPPSRAVEAAWDQYSA